MTLTRIGKLLELNERPGPVPGSRQILFTFAACSICRTNQYVVDNELPDTEPTIKPGHDIVGVVYELASRDRSLERGQRVGVPWLGAAGLTMSS